MSGIISPSGKRVLDSLLYMYVRKDGSDTNDGSANDSAHAFLTIGKAIEVYESLDCNGYDVRIDVADGTYIEQIFISNRLGAGNLFIFGNISNPGNVIVDGDVNNSLWVKGHRLGSYVQIDGFKLTTDPFGGNGILAEDGAEVRIGRINFGDVGYSHVQAYSGAKVLFLYPYEISGDADNHIEADVGAIIQNYINGNVTLSGSPVTFGTAFALCYTTGVIEIYSPTVNFVITGVVGQRYLCEQNSIINTFGGGAAYLPGSVAGSIATQGQYL